MSASPSPLHPNQCRCGACLEARKAQYRADMDGAAQHPAIRTTRPDQVGAGLEMSLRFLEPLKARIADLERQLAAIRSFNITLNKANEAGEPRGLELDGEVWVVNPGDNAYEHWKRWMEKDQERRATR